MSDEIRRLRLPLDVEEVRSLRAGEMVLLSGDIILTAGLPTHKRIEEYLDAGKDLPLGLHGQTLFHLGSYSRDAADGGLEVLYINPTTSTRFNSYMPRFIRHFGLRMVGGKGGLDAASAAAMKDVGCVYLSFVGGGSPLLSDAVKGVVSVHWPDLIAHFRLVKLRVEDLGPLTVGIDAHGNSLYDSLQQQAADRMPEIMAGLAARRAATNP
ncbi:fumarate hydratase C-terminal domain-containing protein [Pseudoroseomonas ludipueritiae]|uniref:Fumarate hydratase C-terminal domain-containing protein n=1 Tax=Pseudoroseomonas ludipueritiae TaxID=198093 RepID=A0ABR7R2W7_9PROT|nr:fumarate hydratase C-terminal domain-containing protein [Pseudoroseomonas ludipueritiae]MBC9176065.1 fumarate hydratase C-terminal domain-containing protein [Pseudoroseomonas ludipueritiae]